MVGVFDCQECQKRFYTDKDMIPFSDAIHVGYDDVDGYVESLYICEGCAEMSEIEQANRDGTGLGSEPGAGGFWSGGYTEK